MKKDFLMDCAKAAVVITFAVGTIIALFGAQDEIGIAVGFVLGGCTYLLATKWAEDDQDKRAGITDAVEKELEG